MRNDNLTREEAALRSRLLHVESYDVHVDLTNASDATMPSFPTRTTVRFAADLDVAGETFIEYIHHSIDSVELNGRRLDRSVVVEGSRIRLPELQPENVLTVRGDSWYSRSGEGLHRFLDPEDGRTYLYTQYEPSDCRRVFPVFEQPDLKASFVFSVTAPQDWVVGSNTEVVSTQEDPTVEGITKRRFAPTQRISTYITTLLAGQYHAVTRLYRPENEALSTLPMTLYCRQALASHLPEEELFELTSAGLDFFQDLFDYPYPFSTYDQAFVPEYNLGAMENPGLVTFTESYLFPGGATRAQRETRANVVMHEMSHMWFGDLVTMAWWSDLWLKESFAEFMGALAAERVGGYEDSWVTFAHQRKAWAYEQDSRSTTHPIVADVPDVEAAKQNFDGITYAKGASVLKQLVAYVGFEQFVAAARSYFRAHAFGTATLADFLGALEQACGRDLSAWSRAWLQSSGVSRLFLDTERGRILQELPQGADPALGRPHRLRVADWTATDGSLIAGEEHDVEIPAGPEGTETSSPADPGAALVLLNQDDLTYALSTLAPRQLETALSIGHRLERPIDRAVLGSTLWSMLRDGDLSPEKFLEHVLLQMPGETSATLLGTALAHAQQALDEYLPPERRAGPAARFASALSVCLEQAEPSSDGQRILLRHALRAARRSPELLDTAREVLDAAEQGATFRGLPVHDEQAWAARTALAAHGELDRTALEEALAARPNQHASIGCAQALASLPSPEEKRRAFEAVYAEDLSNDVLTATAVGFGTGDPELRRPYAETYFRRLLEVWERFSIGMATRIVHGLYPDLDAAPDVAARTRTWLAEHPEAPGALVRALVEHAEDAERAARVRRA